MKIKYWILLTFLGAIWGSAFMFVKIATPEFGPFLTTNLRLFFASIIFLPFLLKKKYLSLFKTTWKYSLIYGCIHNAIPFTLFSYASLESDSNMLAILNSTTAFITMLIAYVWLKEKIKLIQIFGLIIGFSGVVVVVNPDNSNISNQSILMCLVAASLYAFSNVFIQKRSANVNIFVIVGWSIIFSTLVLAPLSFVTLPTTMPSYNAILSTLWLGSISTGLAFFGYIYLINNIGAVKTSTVAYFLPLFGILWGYIFLNEIISIYAFLGCIMILFGIFFATLHKVKSLKEI